MNSGNNPLFLSKHSLLIIKLLDFCIEKLYIFYRNVFRIQDTTKKGVKNGTIQT
jgi:hypothetical protein